MYKPPDVVLRTAFRTITGHLQQTCVSRSCSVTSMRSYKAAVCAQLGKPLEIHDIPKIEVIPDKQVLIAVHAAAVNFADILTVQGKYQVRPQTPFVPGSEFSGTIEGVGKGVDKFKKGDSVIAIPVGGGGYGQMCLVNPEKDVLLPAPKCLSMLQSAAAIVSYGTAMMALSRIAHLKEGETVLITGAAGATGLAAVDIALNLFKAKVIGVCSGQDKCLLLQQRGVQHCIDYSKQRLGDSIKKITQGHGADVVMDQVGGEAFTESLKKVAFEGRIVTVGYASGIIPSVPVNQLLLKNCSVHGLWWGNYFERHPEVFKQSISDITQAFASGKLSPYVGNTFPLSEVNTAFSFILNRQSVGKVLLTMTESKPKL